MESAAGTYKGWEMGSNLSSAVGFVGMDEFKTKIQEVYWDISGPMMQEALYAAARVVARAIMAATPLGRREYVYHRNGKSQIIRSRRPIGQARANVIIYKRQPNKLYQIQNEDRALLVGYEKKAAYYMYWYEYGRYGQPARPFARSAFETAYTDAWNAVESTMSQKMQKAA